MSKSLKELQNPNVVISDNELGEADFIKSGKEKYKALVNAFSKELFERSILLCDAGNLGGDREVTQEYVVKASHIIYGKSNEKQSNKDVFLQVVEYLCSAGVGAGASNLGDNWGEIVFGVSLVIGIVAFVTRTVNKK